MPPLPPSRTSSSSSSSSSESHKLVAFLFTLFAIVLCLSLAATNTNDEDDDIFSFSGNEDAFLSTVLDENNPAHPMNLLKNVPLDDPERKKTYCAKVANVGDWYFGEKACEYAEMEMDFAHSPFCTEKERAKKKNTRRREKGSMMFLPSSSLFGWNRGREYAKAKAWVPDEGLMDACQFFRFASATTPAAEALEKSSGGGDASGGASLVIDTDVTATPDAETAVEAAAGEGGEEIEDENALNDFAIQRMMQGRDALFVGDSQVRHVYAAFLRIAAVGDAHEAHLHPPKRPKLKSSAFNRKYRLYAKSARKTNGKAAVEESGEQNIEAEVVGDIPGDKHAKTDPLKHRNWTFAIQGGGVAHFVWAPEAKDVVEVVKERLLLDSDGESTKDSKFASPDFLVAGVGLWHMLHEADPNDFQRQVAEVKALLDDIDFKTTVPFWLTVSKPGPSHLMNSVKKQTHLTKDSWALYREATEKEFSDDASQTLAIDFGALTEKCGSRCSVDGVHVDETAYDAAAQILLNALASLWDVKIPNFRFSSSGSKKEEATEEDSEYEPLDFKEPEGGEEEPEEEPEESDSSADDAV